MQEPFDVIATCPEETKDVLVQELEALGAGPIEPGYRSVRFRCSAQVFYEAHLKLRTASRLLAVIKEFPAHGPQMLFDQARRIRWAEIFSVDRTYLVEGIPGDRGSEFMSGNEISKRVREAIETSFRKSAGKIPRVDLKEPDVTVVAFVRGGRCVLSVDTSGKALHKRGYRGPGHPAPIKETLAAAILKLAGYDGNSPLWDPFCGSGTIAIEAAYVALGKAPLIHRKRGEFGFERLCLFDKDLWRRTQERVRVERREEPPAPILASDLSGDYVALARDNALRARVEKHMQFATGSFQELAARGIPLEIATGSQPLIVANLPYGERIGKEELKELYVSIGDTLKRHCPGWRAALLAAENAPYKFIGLKPSRRIPILNGSIRCKLLIYELYEGSRRRGGEERA